MASVVVRVASTADTFDSLMRDSTQKRWKPSPALNRKRWRSKNRSTEGTEQPVSLPTPTTCSAQRYDSAKASHAVVQGSSASDVLLHWRQRARAGLAWTEAVVLAALGCFWCLPMILRPSRYERMTGMRTGMCRNGVVSCLGASCNNSAMPKRRPPALRPEKGQLAATARAIIVNCWAAAHKRLLLERLALANADSQMHVF